MGLEQIVVVLQGGLGNKLFQYAAGLDIANETGAELLIHERGNRDFSRFIDFETRPADHRLLRSLVFDPPPQDSFLESIGWRLRTELLRARRRMTKYRQPTSFDARPPWLSSGGSKILGLVGYFQHPSWYESTLHTMAQSLGTAIDRAIDPSLRDQIESLGDYTVVSFRRGDYLRYATELTLDHYQRAIDLLPRRSGALVITSDDELIAEFGESWFSERGFRRCSSTTIRRTESTPRSGCHSRATQVVMANSTFCWWGTVLGDLRAAGANRDRWVIAPKHWLDDPPGAEILVRSTWNAI